MRLEKVRIGKGNDGANDTHPMCNLWASCTVTENDPSSMTCTSCAFRLHLLIVRTKVLKVTTSSTLRLDLPHIEHMFYCYLPLSLIAYRSQYFRIFYRSLSVMSEESKILFLRGVLAGWVLPSDRNNFGQLIRTQSVCTILLPFSSSGILRSSYAFFFR